LKQSTPLEFGTVLDIVQTFFFVSECINIVKFNLVHSLFLQEISCYFFIREKKKKEKKKIELKFHAVCTALNVTFI